MYKFFLVFVFLVGLINATILDSSRVVTWQGNAGVDGGIPSVYTKYGSTIATADQGDDTSAIQDSLNNAANGQYILLGSGTFTITGTITIPDSVILRGGGIDVTTLEQQGGSSGATLSFGGGSYSGTDYNLASGYTKGSTNITTSSSHGWSAGDIIIIDETAPGTGYDPPITNVGSDGTCGWCGRDSGTRCVGQLVQLGTASGTTATLEIPLYFTFESEYTPQGCKLNSPTLGAGIEELTIDNSSTMSSNQDETGTINMTGSVNCWVLNVEIYGAKRMGINIARSYRCTIQGVEVHKTLYYTSNNGYSLWLRYGVSACLIENNIWHDMAAGPNVNGPTSGNVIAYNYATNMYSTDYPTANRGGFVFHGGHAMFNLLEGNYFDGCYLAADQYWGTSSNNTFHRCKIFYDVSKSAQRLNVAIDYRSWYNNFIGSVLGTDNESEYISNSIPYGGDPAAIYVFEWGGSDSTTEKAILHGNYDYYNDSIVWDAGIADHNLLDSYYYASEPSWWQDQGSGRPWPIIGSDLSPIAQDIPAKDRYEGEQWQGSGSGSSGFSTKKLDAVSMQGEN